MSHPAAPTLSTPRVGVSAFLEHEGKLLLIERGQAPNRGQLAFPGGKLKWGETLTEAVDRELKEETRIIARATQLLDAVNVFVHDDNQMLARHFVVLFFRCRWLVGITVDTADTYNH